MNGMKVVPVTDLRRNFGEITADLSTVEEMILTKDGRPFAIMRAAPEEKKKIMRGFAGSLKGTDLDNDKIWEEVMKRKSRIGTIDL